MVDKRNIVLENTVTSHAYVSTGSRGSSSYPLRNKEEHATYIKRLLSKSYKDELTQKQAAAIRYKTGMYLEFASAPGYDLEIKSLENRNQGISLLNVHEDVETGVTRATVYIPEGKENFFLKQVEEYQVEFTKKGNPKHEKLVTSIEDIQRAVLDSFWFGEKNEIPNEHKKWCEVWFRVPNNNKSLVMMPEEVENAVNDICQALQIEIKPEKIVFPERLVKLLWVTEEDLLNLLNACNLVAEIRQAYEPTSFFTSLSNKEQKDWNQELLNRTTFAIDGTSVCLLDTGLNNQHQLLVNATSEEHIQTVNSAWGVSDHQGHGTEMAGVALYFDLKEQLLSGDPVVVTHEIESVKILPPTGENPVELYGDLTQQAINSAEIANPNTHRVVCMAVSSPNHNTKDGSPTSWSGAIDNITSGALEENVKRLVVISAGNVYPEELFKISYPDANILHSVESPGQAWNAVTVGAYSGKIQIDEEELSDFHAVSQVDELSPFSSTSLSWSSKWPIKPDVLFDGGNVATNGTDYIVCEDLSLLTTNRTPLIKQYSTINATSAATAQAACFAAQLMSEYPDLWPETIRALMIHSANWTSNMKRQFCTDDKKTTGRRALLKTCGYGIPNLEKAIRCFDNSVNMIIEGELQPYTKKSMNEMHVHKVPWPSEMLLALENTPVTMRVTLSYFIEPGPGEVGWKDKYRYPSCGLRFDVINADETLDDFQKRINVKMRGDDKKDSGDGTSGSSRWYLGADNRDVGSIHSDMMIDISASELCNCEYIAVYPVVGWWRERGYLGKYDSKQRYSLVVSLSTPDAKIDFYTEIQTKIGNVVQISV